MDSFLRKYYLVFLWLLLFSSLLLVTEGTEHFENLMKSHHTLQQNSNSVYFTEVVGILQKSSQSDALVIMVDNSDEPESFGFRMDMIAQISASHHFGLTYLSPNLNFEDKLKNIASSTFRTTVIILCQHDVVLDIFHRVSLKSLESRNLLWIVFSTQTSVMDKKLGSILREGTEVMIIRKSKQIEKKMEIYEIHRLNNTFSSFIRIGHFDKQGEQTVVHSSRNRIVPNIDEKYNTFHGRELTLPSNGRFLFLRKKLYPNGTESDEFEGIDYEIIKALSSLFNFTYHFKEPADKKWGGPLPNGTVTGMIGMVARHEVNFGINVITITHVRNTVNDFSFPYMIEGSVVVSKAPKEKSHPFVVLSPFSYLIWASIIFAIFVVGLITWLLQKIILSSQGLVEKRSLMGFFTLNTFRTLVVQGNKIKSSSNSVRTLVIFWMIFEIIIGALYSGNLVARFASITYEDPINNLSDLLKALKKSNMYLSVMGNTAISDLFLKATFGTHKEIAKYIDPEKSFGGDNVRYPMTLTGVTVIASSYTLSDINSRTWGRSNFYISNEQFYFQPYGAAFPIGSPYRDNFSKAFQRMSEAGLITKWHYEARRDDLRQKGVKYSVIQYTSKTGRGNSPINLEQMQAAFYILSGGFMCALIVFLFEVAINC